MSSVEVTYEDGRNLKAGEHFITDQQPVAADTYYVGMLLEYNATTDVYEALTTDANMAAIYNGTDGRVLGSAGEDNLVLAGEIQKGSVVDGSGSAVTLTQDQIATYRNRGFIFK